MRLSEAPADSLKVADKVVELVNKAGIKRLQTFRNYNSRMKKIRIKLYGIQGYSMTPDHTKMLKQLGFNELRARTYSMVVYVDANDRKRLNNIVVPPVVPDIISPYVAVRQPPLSKDTPEPGQTWSIEGDEVTVLALAKENDWDETRVVFHTGDLNFCRLMTETAFRRAGKKVKK